MPFLDLLPQYGVAPYWLDARFGAYPPSAKLARPVWGVGCLADGLLRTIRARSSDVTFIQRSLVSSIPSFEKLITKPFVLDIDDAVFLTGKVGWHDSIARRATHIICGNQYLASHYEGLAPITVIPTTVVAGEFLPPPHKPHSTVLGWSGTSSGFRYLYLIERALSVVLRRFPDATLKIVADKPPRFTLLPMDKVEFQAWTPETALSSIQSFSVGLMPLDDSEWSKGKCSFKMLTYMAAEIPVMVSPVGNNIEVLKLGPCGFSADGEDEWVEKLSAMIDSEDLRRSMGACGRRIIVSHFDTRIHAPTFARVITESRPTGSF